MWSYLISCLRLNNREIEFSSLYSSSCSMTMVLWEKEESEWHSDPEWQSGCTWLSRRLLFLMLLVLAWAEQT
jgi:hypothetical protein